MLRGRLAYYTLYIYNYFRDLIFGTSTSKTEPDSKEESLTEDNTAADSMVVKDSAGPTKHSKVSNGTKYLDESQDMAALSMNPNESLGEGDLCLCVIGSGDNSQGGLSSVEGEEYEGTVEVEEADHVVDVRNEELLVASALASSEDEFMELEDASTPRVEGGADNALLNDGGDFCDEEVPSDIEQGYEEIDTFDNSSSGGIDIREEGEECSTSRFRKASTMSSLKNENLLDETMSKHEEPVSISRKLKWTPKPSVPSYMINATKNINVEQLEKMSITTKGKAAKMAAEQKERMSKKVKAVKDKLRDENFKSKEESMMLRKECVAAERARVLAAKKAREEMAERLRLEAAERRKRENMEKNMLKEEAEKKLHEIHNARKSLFTAKGT